MDEAIAGDGGAARRRPQRRLFWAPAARAAITLCDFVMRLGLASRSSARKAARGRRQVALDDSLLRPDTERMSDVPIGAFT